jgi:hypothetical protein
VLDLGARQGALEGMVRTFGVRDELGYLVAVGNFLMGDLPLQPGDAAPDFHMPAVHKEGCISLADYRGRSPVLLAIFRGLYCPFCRRAIAQFGTMREKLLKAGVESLAIVCH